MADEETQVQAESQIPAAVNEDVSPPEADNLFELSPEEKANAEIATGEPEPAQEQEAAVATEAEVPAKEPEPQIAPDVQRAMEDIQRRDIELRRREQEIKQQYAAARELEELKAVLKKDPLAAVQRIGGDPTAIMEALMGPDASQQEIASSPVIKKLMTEIDSLKQNLSARDQQRQREIQQQHQARLYNEYAQAAATVNKEEHPLLSVFSDRYAPDTMFERAAAYAQKYNAVPDVQQLTRETEQLLDQQAMDLIGRLSSVPKYAKYFAKATGESQPGLAPTSTTPPTAKGSTLRNKDTAEPPPAAKAINWSEATEREILDRVSAAVPKLFDQ